MKVLSVNIAKAEEISWKGKTWTTGIFKKTTNKPIFLGKEDVKEDAVINRKHHGGNEMAVYAFSKKHYAYFQKLYPKIKFYHGIFGENITVANLEETEIYIGDIYKVGEAIIQVSQPRLPCLTLSAVFKSDILMKQFINTTFSGAYFRVLHEGFVAKNNTFSLLERQKNSMTLAQIFSLFTSNKQNKVLIEKALQLETLSTRIKGDIKRKLL